MCVCISFGEMGSSNRRILKGQLDVGQLDGQMQRQTIRDLFTKKVKGEG